MCATKWHAKISHHSNFHVCAKWEHINRNIFYFFFSSLGYFHIIYSSIFSSMLKFWHAFLVFNPLLHFHSIPLFLLLLHIQFFFFGKKRKNEERKSGGMEKDMRMAEIKKKYILVIVATLEIYVTAALNMWVWYESVQH